MRSTSSGQPKKLFLGSLVIRLNNETGNKIVKNAERIISKFLNKNVDIKTELRRMRISLRARARTSLKQGGLTTNEIVNSRRTKRSSVNRSAYLH